MRKLFRRNLLTKGPRCAILSWQQGRTPWDSRAGVAELADARDLKSRETKVSYRFEPGVRHFPSESNIAG